MHIQYIKIYKEMILIFLFVSDDKIHVVYWNEIPITYVKHLHMYMRSAPYEYIHDIPILHSLGNW